MARKTLAETRAEKLAQLEALKSEIEGIEDKEAKRLGRLSIKAGLADLKIPESDLLSALKELAGRFRESSKKQTSVLPSSTHEDGKAVGQDSV